MTLREVMTIVLLSIAVLPTSSTTHTCEMLKKSQYNNNGLIMSDATNLRICTGPSSSCCTKEIEDQMAQSAERIFRTQLQDKVIVLRHMINVNLNSFRTYFYNSLNTCQTHLDTLFKHTYGPFYETNSKVFDTFFNRLRAFSSPYSEANVEIITNQLFEQLFRIVFSLLNPLHEVTESQWSCMSEGLVEMSPFGDVPTKVAAHLEKTLTTFKQFTTALEKTHSILEGFMNTSLSTECISNLARMTDCSMCTSTKSVKPCPGLCLNVMKGCLADWSEIDQQWNSVVGSLQKLTIKVKGAHNLQNTLNPLPVQISEAVMTFQERGTTITNKVLARCFSMDATPSLRQSMRSRRSVSIRSKRAVWLRSVMDQSEGHWRILHQLMNTFGDRLAAMRGWFKSLPTEFCTEDGLAAKNEEECWNGASIGEYSNEIAGDGLSSQMSNPEYQGARFLPYRGLFVEERLQLGMLSFKLQNALNGRNYSNYEMEGSAALPDDEDYVDGSGDISIVNLDPSSEPADHRLDSFKLVKSSNSIVFSSLHLLFLVSLYMTRLLNLL